ncbi:hypothetical protein TNCV_2195701 [Trichonephila clavipes]|nr:hypothetical protein TNCV_2195701 [Trichonephila clavipes]
MPAMVGYLNHWATAAPERITETEIKCIPFDEIRIKSPFPYPMDFCAFSLSKRALGKRLPRTNTERTLENCSRGLE